MSKAEPQAEPHVASRADELRRAFDRSFAEPATTEIGRFEDLLAIRIAGEPFAIRLRDVAGLFADKSITALPSPLPELVGLAGFRGGVVPVYDLRALLGYPKNEPTRWMLLATTPALALAAAGPLALAFDRFEGHLRVSPDAIASEPPRREFAGFVREVVRVEDGSRPIVNIASVLEAIVRRAQPHSLLKPHSHLTVSQQEEIPQRER